MKRLSKLTKGLIAAFVALPIVAFGAVPALAFTGQSSEGQFSNIYQIKDETTNGAWGNTISANACDSLRYKEMIYNPGPSVVTNVMVQATLPSAAATSNTSTITTSSATAQPTSVSLTASVNFPSAQSISYTNGTTELLDQNNNLLKTLPDGITNAGVNIGDLAASGTEFVQFDTKVNCPAPTPPKPPVTPPSPTYTCTELGLTAENNRTVKISSFSTAQANGAVFKNAVINWGDNSTALTSSNVVGQTHQYAADGTYTVIATAHFTVNGQDVTAGGPQCEQQVTFSSTTPPTVTPPSTPPATPAAPTTPTALVNTGPGSVVGLFAAATTAGTFGYRWMLSRRLSRQ
jgi:hypothetical protein